jgi:hypothetical protein
MFNNIQKECLIVCNHKFCHEHSVFVKMMDDWGLGLFWHIVPRINQATHKMLWCGWKFLLKMWIKEFVGSCGCMAVFPSFADNLMHTQCFVMPLFYSAVTAVNFCTWNSVLLTTDTKQWLLVSSWVQVRIVANNMWFIAPIVCVTDVQYNQPENIMTSSCTFALLVKCCYCIIHSSTSLL